MLSGQYVDLSEVVERIFQDYPISEEILVSDVALWTYRGLKLLGVPDFYIEKTTDGTIGNPSPIVIENYRGSLPIDISYLVLVRDYDTKLPMYCTSSPYKSDFTYPIDMYESSLAYHTNNTFIYTSFETGNLEMVYKAFPTSPIGLPMVPDDEKVLEFLTHSVAERIYYKLYLEDKISERQYEKVAQKAAFYGGSARNHAKMPSVDKMESIKNRWVRLVQSENLHDASFRYYPDKDRLTLHTLNSLRNA